MHFNENIRNELKIQEKSRGNFSLIFTVFIEFMNIQSIFFHNLP